MDTHENTNLIFQQSKKCLGLSEMLKEAADKCGGMQKSTFLQLINHLWAITGRTNPPSGDLLIGWYIAMRDVTAVELFDAIDRYSRERSSEYPTPQLLRELAGVQTPRTATTEPHLSQEWLDVKKICKDLPGPNNMQERADMLGPERLAAVKAFGGSAKIVDVSLANQYEQKAYAREYLDHLKDATEGKANNGSTSSH